MSNDIIDGHIDWQHQRTQRTQTILNTYHWQLARVLRDKEYPHLRGCLVWVEIGKPQLYPVVGRKKIRLVRSNLSEGFTPLGQNGAGFPPRNIERLAHLVDDFFPPFAAYVLTIQKEVWTDPNWRGEYPDYGMPYLPVTRWGKSPATAKSQRGAGTRLAKGVRKERRREEKQTS